MLVSVAPLPKTHVDDETDGSHPPWLGRRMRLREAVRSAARTREG
jgi:hypothetical protein